jgi:copper ion binding protein
MTKTKINVDGMSCQHCVKAVTDAVSAVPGVKKVKVSLKAKTADVAYDADTTTLETIVSAITGAGYEVA